MTRPDETLEKLTREDIELMRPQEGKHVLWRDPVAANKLCDMALASLEAPQDLVKALEACSQLIADQFKESDPTTGEAISKEALPAWNLVCQALSLAKGGGNG